VRCAESIESSIAFCRRSSASLMRGNASLASSTIVKPNTSRGQTINPTPGLIRKLPFEARTAIALDDERGQQPGHESVEEAGLGQREPEPLQLSYLVAHLRLAGDRFDRLAEDEADADARADGAETATDSQADRLAGLGGFFGSGREQ